MKMTKLKCGSETGRKMFPLVQKDVDHWGGERAMIHPTRELVERVCRHYGIDPDSVPVENLASFLLLKVDQKITMTMDVMFRRDRPPFVIRKTDGTAEYDSSEVEQGGGRLYPIDITADEYDMWCSAEDAEMLPAP